MANFFLQCRLANRFLEIDSWAPYKFKYTVSGGICRKRQAEKAINGTLKFFLTAALGIFEAE
jgi:hypothetical protein